MFRYTPLLACMSMLCLTDQAQAYCGGISDPSEVRISDEVQYSFSYQGQSYTRLGRMYAPKPGSQTAACPMIVVLPGGCGDKESAEWNGPLIASRGYVVFVAEVEAALITGQIGTANAQVCTEAAKGVMDFLQSPANPYLSDSNTESIGGAGFSLGARTWVKIQEVDERVDAIVSWDNLATSEDGDLGSPACINTPGVIREPRVPAMGQASELPCLEEPDRAGRDIDAKKTGFLHWREAGIPAMEIVIRGVGHTAWSGQPSAFRPVFNYYTTNWFDRFLKGDLSATERLVAREIEVDGELLGASRIYSAEWNSAAFFDGYDCADFFAGCIPGQDASWSWALTGKAVNGTVEPAGIACTATGDCVASGGIVRLDETVNAVSLDFGGQAELVGMTDTRPAAGYLWTITSDGTPGDATVIPGFLARDVAIQADGMRIVGGRGFGVVATEAGPFTTASKAATWLAVSPDGAILTGASMGSEPTDSINNVVLGANDSIVVAGTYGESGSNRAIRFPDGSRERFYGGGNDAFLALFSASGNFLWGLALPGDGSETISALATTDDNRILICGDFDSRIKLRGPAAVAVPGTTDIFVAQLNGAGRVEWARSFSSAADLSCDDVVASGPGEVLVSGLFEGPLALDATALNATSRDIFIARLSRADGSVLGATQIGSASDVDDGCNLALDSNGAAWCQGTARSVLGYTTGRLNTSDDQFLVRLDPQTLVVDQGLALRGDGQTRGSGMVINGAAGLSSGTLVGNATAFPFNLEADENADSNFFISGFSVE
jgi:hypothetical protein